MLIDTSDCSVKLNHSYKAKNESPGQTSTYAGWRRGEVLVCELDSQPAVPSLAEQGLQCKAQCPTKCGLRAA